jgi:signal transduction histidine kinase
LNPLEAILKQRTRELTATKLKLKISLTNQRKSDAILKESNLHHTKLLKESLLLQEQLRRLTRQLLKGQEKDRRDLGRELQNEIVQTLLGINLQILTLQKQAQGNSQGLQDEIAETKLLVTQSAHSLARVARKQK